MKKQEDNEIIKTILNDLNNLTKELKTKKFYIVKTSLGDDNLNELENFFEKTLKLIN